MTDHKPLSEGMNEDRRQAWRAAICTHMEMVCRVAPETRAFWRKELDKFDAMFPYPLPASPKLLDGEALQLMTDRQNDLARLMEATGVRNDGLSSPKQLFERCLAAVDGKASSNAEEAEAKAVLATKEFLEAHGYTVTLSCEVTEEEVENALTDDATGLPIFSPRTVIVSLAQAGLRIVKDGAPTQARPEQVFDSLSEPIRQHSERIQYELRKDGWWIVRAPL